jgi:hypothetical protein
VPFKSKDDTTQADNSGEVYTYVMCAVCPVKQTKAVLHYVAEEKLFLDGGISQVAQAPAVGFLFPAFDNRATNIYNALFYTKDSGKGHEDFVDAVFRTQAPIPAGGQKELFGEILGQSLEEDCRFDVVQAVHEQLSERMTVHKESKDPEPLTISSAELGDILEDSGLEPERVESFCESIDKQFGKDAALRPANIIDSKKLEICTPEVKVTVDPKFGYLVQTKVIDGKKYILISADAGVEVNGISVEIE